MFWFFHNIQWVILICFLKEVSAFFSPFTQIQSFPRSMCLNEYSSSFPFNYLVQNLSSLKILNVQTGLTLKNNPNPTVNEKITNDMDSIKSKSLLLFPPVNRPTTFSVPM